MNNIATVSRVKVSADGHGVLSHAGVGMVREVADLTGLSEQVTAVLADTYRGRWSHAPGAVFADLVAAVADGADCVDNAAQASRSRSEVFGPAASTTTMWRLIDERIDADHLPAMRTARAQARAAAWAAGAAPTTEWLYIDVDATITIDHSEGKENAAATWKRTFGMHPLMAYLDRPDIAGGEALAALLRPGNAGSNTTADHITVLDQALESLPQDYRPTPGVGGGPKILVRSDSAGATHGFAAACRDAGVGFSFGFAVDHRVREAVEHLNATAGWMPAIDSDGENRDGAWIAEATDLVSLGSWPVGTRLLLRKERPHPGAQLNFTDSDGHRVTAFITDTRRSVVPGGMAGLELRHRQHARVEDRIRQAKATGLRNLPCHSFGANAAWLEIIGAATDLVAWTKLIGFADEPALARCEIETFRYRVLHVAARITRGARVIRLRIDSSWQWAQQIADAWCRIRCAFT
ncbi:MAG: IS1380 family transposase [Renibacterium salmoninarum]|nr:IS1380 family transposase [Renibacterium salmoninarum]